MRQKVDGAPLKGGPSDGKTYMPGTRWPTYLYRNGERMPAAMGDRVLRGRSRKADGCYVIEKEAGKVVGYVWTEVNS